MNPRPERSSMQTLVRRHLLTTAFVLGSLTLLLAPAAPANAHEALVSASPDSDERFETAPTQVELVFTAELLQIGDQGAYVEVVDEGGTNWVLGPISVAGAVVTAPLDPAMPDAGYQVRWQVVSGDGHPISGLIPFTVGDAEPFESATPESSPAPSNASPDDSSTPVNSPIVRLGIIAVMGAGASFAIFLIVTRIVRRRRARDS